MQPLIGVSVTPTIVEDRPMEAVNRAYVAAVAHAGGLPVVLPTLDPERAPAMLARLDGLLLSGGGDVDPQHYGERPSPLLAGVDAERDGWELALVAACVAQRRPLLGICRGLQVLNVALGGTLEQHVPDRTGTSHRDAERFAEAVHAVEVRCGSRLAAALGPALVGRQLGVNSLHHQAVARPGDGLRISAAAPDGTVEAIEHTGDLALLGVQWHPELLTHEPAQRALFTWLVDRAAAPDVGSGLRSAA